MIAWFRFCGGWIACSIEIRLSHWERKEEREEQGDMGLKEGSGGGTYALVDFAED